MHREAGAKQHSEVQIDSKSSQGSRRTEGLGKGGCEILLDGENLGREGGSDSLWEDGMSQESKHGDVQLALGSVHGNAIVLKTPEKLAPTGAVSFRLWAHNKTIIMYANAKSRSW